MARDLQTRRRGGFMSRAQDIMTKVPITLPFNATVGEAIDLLQSLDIRHVPVINEQREVVGMLSDRDLRALSIPRVVDDSWVSDLRAALAMPIAQAMSGGVISVEEESETSEIIELMLEHKVGALPVVDADETLVGIVSYIDVLRELYELETDAD
jgi:CBS domain-containing protein